MLGGYGRARPSRRSARAAREPIPPWVAPTDRVLLNALARVRVIALTTPKNYRVELDRITARWARGRAAAPAFEYDAPTHFDDLRRALEALSDRLDREGPLGTLYAARARELADEAAVCASAGTPSLWAAARRRFSRRDAFDDGADALANEWLDARDADEAAHVELVRTDDEADARSLLLRMRAEIGRRRLPVRVVVVRDMASLAAAGDGFVHVAQNRFIAPRDVERTVLHEIDGHVVPRVRSASLPLGLFAIGTARGADDQEGRALALERASGRLDVGRRRELALRHVATRCVERGATFVDTVQRLLARTASVADGVRIAARAHRGGGLGREAVYLPALLRVEAALRTDPGLDRVIASGRVAVDAARVLQPWVE